jgi:glycosyltransferase involved in cell wall biosynthesis
MRVAAFMDTHNVSGPAKQLVEVIPELARVGVYVTVIAVVAEHESSTPFTELLDRKGADYVTVSSRGRLDREMISEFSRLLETMNPDLLQTHSYRPAFLAWLLRARSSQAWRWVAFFHGETAEDLKVRLYNAVDKFVMRSADLLVIVAESQRQRVRNTRGIAHIANAALLPPLPDADSGDALLAENGPIIGYVGRLSHEKGVDVLLEATALLVADGINFALIIAGEGPELPRLQAQAEELGVAGTVRFIGHVQNPTALYGKLSLFVLPSRSEGMPNVLFEALRFRVPVVATSVGDVPSMIVSDELGRLVPSDNSRALADAMRSMIVGGCVPVSLEAQTRFLETHSVERRAASLSTIYRSVTSMRGEFA